MNILLFGGTGQVGGAVARALIDSPVCTRLTLLNRRAAGTITDAPKVSEVIVDTAAPDFEQRTANVARGHDAAICCIGIGAGSAAMSEADLLRIEVDTVGAYARGCKAAGIEVFELLTAVGTTERSADSRIKYTRVMGKKLKTVLAVGFDRLAVFRPGTIVGNKHTPGWAAWIAKWLPASLGWGAIDQDRIGQAFLGHLVTEAQRQREAVVYYDNREMERLAGEGAIRR